jgi:hypothetical protein
MKSALALVYNVRLSGFVRWKDYNIFAPIFYTTVGALCSVKKLAKFFTMMFHLVFSFVPIITQCPASGFSALTGYGGRCTARTVSEETKKNSPIIIATNVSFMTAGGRGMFALSHPPSTEALGRSSRKTLNGDSIEPVLKQLNQAGIPKMQRTSVTTGGPAGFAARFGVPGERRRMLKKLPRKLRATRSQPQFACRSLAR